MRDIDLRQELSSSIECYGLKALYIRENKYVRCRCYNQLHRSGDASCKICGGFGHLTAIEPVRFIYDNNYFRDGEAENKGLGMTSTESIVLYMDYRSQPKVKDRVYITNWIGTVPQEIARVYIVSAIDEMRMDDGRIEAYAVTAKLRTDLLKNANDSLNALDSKSKINLGKGGKHIWPYSNVPN